MSEFKPRGPVERDAERAFRVGQSIDKNPHPIGSESYDAWEQAYLRLSFAQIDVKDAVTA